MAGGSKRKIDGRWYGVGQYYMLSTIANAMSDGVDAPIASVAKGGGYGVGKATDFITSLGGKVDKKGNCTLPKRFAAKVRAA